MSGRPARSWRRPVLASVAAALLATTLSGCGEVASPAAEEHRAAKVESVDGLDVKRVSFTPDGAARLDVRTATARRTPEGVVVPYAALVYDGQGVAWVYTSPRPLTFVRVRVAVDRIDADEAVLRGGLPAGTRVVTQGASEVYGAELGIEGGH